MLRGFVPIEAGRGATLSPDALGSGYRSITGNPQGIRQQDFADLLRQHVPAMTAHGS
jgi:hypothetical protein